MLYAPDARFKDPAFGELTGEEAGDMWRMLTSRAEDLKVELAEHEADGDTGQRPLDRRPTPSAPAAPWSTTSRRRFRFRDGKIVDHEDSLPVRTSGRVRRWAPAGWVLGLPGLQPADPPEGARATWTSSAPSARGEPA